MKPSETSLKLALLEVDNRLQRLEGFFSVDRPEEEERAEDARQARATVDRIMKALEAAK